MTTLNQFGSGTDSNKQTPLTVSSTKTLMAYWATDSNKLYVENSDRTGWIEIPLSSGSSYTDEQVRDVIGAALVPGNNIAIAVNDPADTITINSTVSYSVPMFFTNSPFTNEILLIHVFAESVTFPDEWAGSNSYVGTNPASSFVLTINKNGSPVGTVTISSSGSVAFSTTGTSVSFVSGDILTVTAPSTNDTSISNVAITFKGSR